MGCPGDRDLGGTGAGDTELLHVLLASISMVKHLVKYLAVGLSSETTQADHSILNRIDYNGREKPPRIDPEDLYI